VVKELQSEVADLTMVELYDNSGSIKYLRIEYAGAAFNSEKEFGMSLFGVGSGTTIDYVNFFKVLMTELNSSEEL
jgi:hypothetical protein